MNRFKFLLAQMGKREEFENSRAMILDVSDLPYGDWKQIGEKSWRTGSVGNKTDRGERAHQVGTFTFWRSFRLRNNDFGMWVEIIPFASESDAREAVPELRSSIETNSRSNATVISESQVDSINLPGSDTARFWKQETSRGEGPEYVKLAIGSVNCVVFILALSGSDAEDDWEDFCSIGMAQIDKIRSALDNPKYRRE